MFPNRINLPFWYERGKMVSISYNTKYNKIQNVNYRFCFNVFKCNILYWQWHVWSPSKLKGSYLFSMFKKRVKRNYCEILHYEFDDYQLILLGILSCYMYNSIFCENRSIDHLDSWAAITILSPCRTVHIMQKNKHVMRKRRII